MVVSGEVGKVASGFMAVMQGQPLALSLVIMNFALIGLLYFQSNSFTNQRQENVKLFLAVQTEVQKLLAQCIVPPPADRRGDLPLPNKENL
jgi:hypothetical protein